MLLLRTQSQKKKAKRRLYGDDVSPRVEARVNELNILIQGRRLLDEFKTNSWNTKRQRHESVITPDIHELPAPLLFVWSTFQDYQSNPVKAPRHMMSEVNVFDLCDQRL